MTDEIEPTSENSIAQGGCYTCGSAAGTLSSLCPTCLERNEQKRLRFKDSLAVDAARHDLPILFRLQHYPLLQILLVVLGFVFIFGVYMNFPDFTHESALSISLRALRTTAGLVVLITWVFFWVSLLISEPIWAIAALILPLLVYKFVILKWDEVRYLFIWNCAGILVWLFAFVAYNQMYANYRPTGERPAWAPFDRATNPNFDMPELPDDTLMN